MQLDMDELRQRVAHQELHKQQEESEFGNLVRKMDRAVDEMNWAHRQMGILSVGNQQRTVVPMYQKFGEHLEVFTNLQHRFAQLAQRQANAVTSSGNGDLYLVILSPEQVR